MDKKEDPLLYQPIYKVLEDARTMLYENQKNYHKLSSDYKNKHVEVNVIYRAFLEQQYFITNWIRDLYEIQNRYPTITEEERLVLKEEQRKLMYHFNKIKTDIVNETGMNFSDYENETKEMLSMINTDLSDKTYDPDYVVNEEPYEFKEFNYSTGPLFPPKPLYQQPTSAKPRIDILNNIPVLSQQPQETIYPKQKRDDIEIINNIPFSQPPFFPVEELPKITMSPQQIKIINQFPETVPSRPPQQFQPQQIVLPKSEIEIINKNIPQQQQSLQPQSKQLQIIHPSQNISQQPQVIIQPLQPIPSQNISQQPQIISQQLPQTVSQYPSNIKIVLPENNIIQEYKTPQIEIINTTQQNRPSGPRKIEIVNKINYDKQSPHVQNIEVINQIKKEKQSPHVQNIEVINQIKKEKQSPHVQNVEVVNQIKKEKQSPHVQNIEVINQIKKEKQSPRVQNIEVVNQITREKQTPRVQNIEVINQIKREKQSPNVQNIEVINQIKQEKLSPNIKQTGIESKRDIVSDESIKKFPLGLKTPEKYKSIGNKFQRKSNSTFKSQLSSSLSPPSLQSIKLDDDLTKNKDSLYTDDRIDLVSPIDYKEKSEFTMSVYNEKDEQSEEDEEDYDIQLYDVTKHNMLNIDETEIEKHEFEEKQISKYLGGGKQKQTNKQLKIKNKTNYSYFCK